MIITILTLFPQVFEKIFSASILSRAQKKDLVKIRIVNIRDFATDSHKTVDDKPYGGGVGMIMRVDVVAKAIAFAKSRPKADQSLTEKIKEKIVLLDPTGKLFTQPTARRYLKLDHLILVCGHYEGIDARISHFVDESISIGRYILTGGEIPAMVITDAIVRLIPGVLIKNEATIDESFTQKGLLEAPQYTRPPIFSGYKVPQLLLSGNHQLITKWKTKQSKLRSRKNNGHYRSDFS